MAKTCSRCGGLLYEESVKTVEGRIWLTACYTCGDRTDETISFNRIFRREETSTERNARIERQIRECVEEVKL